MEYIIECLREFNRIEFGDDIEPDMRDKERVPLVYTQSEDGKHDFQWYADLKHKELLLFIDDECEMVHDFKTLKEMGDWLKDTYTGELIDEADVYYQDIWLKA